MIFDLLGVIGILVPYVPLLMQIVGWLLAGPERLRRPTPTKSFWFSGACEIRYESGPKIAHRPRKKKSLRR